MNVGIERSWCAWLVLAAGLVGCNSEWVERQVPGEPNGGEVAPARTYPMHIPPPKDKAKGRAEAANGEADGTREIPLEMQGVTLELPAARARHVKEGDEVDLYATFDPRPYASAKAIEEGFTPPKYAGVVMSSASKVHARACDDRVCALTLLMDHDDTLEVLAMRAAPGTMFHAWVHAEGSEPRERTGPKKLKDILADLEITQDTFDRHLRKPSEFTRRVALEVDNPVLGAALIREGTVGGFVGTFSVDDKNQLVRKEDHASGDPKATVTLLHRVPVERARVEGERVVIEFLVPAEDAEMLAISSNGAERIDFLIQNPKDLTREIRKITNEDYIREAEVIWQAPTRSRLLRRSKKKTTPAIVGE